MNPAQPTCRRMRRPLVALAAALMATLAVVLAPASALAADYTYADGTLGFFKWLGADAAVQIIEDSPNNPIVGPYQDLDNMSSRDSAFNLDNLDRAIDNIEECNQLRANHGATASRIDPYLMAISEVNTNFSKANYLTHSNAYANVSENIAWGFDDPFSRWYHDEKAEWESDELTAPRELMESLLAQGYSYEQARGTAVATYPELTNGGSGRYGVLHYLNLIHPLWLYTGAASAGPNVWGPFESYDVDEQTFYYTTPSSVTYTVAEFRAKLAEYRTLIGANSPSEDEPTSGEPHDIAAMSTSYGRMRISVSKAKAGETVTITLTPNYGYVVDGLPLVLSTDGTIVIAEPTETDGVFTFAMPDCDVTVAAGFRLRFTDVPTWNWAFDAVMWAADNGIMNGYDDGSNRFGAEDGMTRAQLAGILYNMAGKPSVDRGCLAGYTDVANDWYTDAVAWAIESGAIVGNDGRFRPNDTTTREEFVTILWRMEDEPSGTGDLTTFPDGGTASSFAQDALSWAVGEGILNGSGSTGELSPTGDLTRAMGAGILMNMSEA